MSEYPLLKDEIRLKITGDKLENLIRLRKSKILIRLYLEGLFEKLSDMKISDEDELKDINYLIEDYFENFKQ